MAYRRKRYKPYVPPTRENTDDAHGVDAIKDANAMAGRRPYDREGYFDAKSRGWLGNDPDESGEYELGD